jgi:restriction system protein
MGLVLSLLKMIFKLPIVNQIASGAVLFALSFFGLRYGFKLLTPHVPFISLASLFLINIAVSSSLAICAFWSIGQTVGHFLLKSILKGVVLFVPLSFILFKLKVKYNSPVLLIVSVSLAILLPLIYKTLTFRKKTVLNKTLSEIDNFGKDANGNKNTKIAGDLFEEYIRDCFKTLGYQAYTTTEMKIKGIAPKGLEKLSGDGGADVIATSGNERLVIQCKHYSNTVGVEACYQAYGALKVYDGTQAMVITNHFFTEEAKFNASQNNILLMDRFKLTQFIADISKQTETDKSEPMLYQKIFKTKDTKKAA